MARWWQMELSSKSFCLSEGVECGFEPSLDVMIPHSAATLNPLEWDLGTSKATLGVGHAARTNLQGHKIASTYSQCACCSASNHLGCFLFLPLLAQLLESLVTCAQRAAHQLLLIGWGFHLSHCFGAQSFGWWLRSHVPGGPLPEKPTGALQKS